MSGTISMEAAKAFVDTLPVWGVIVDRRKTVHHTNPVARQLGVKNGDFCYKSITGRKDTCTWCHLNNAFEPEAGLVSATVRLKFSPQLGLVDDPEGSVKDGHWLRIDDAYSVHFGFVRTLEDSDKDKVTRELKNILGISADKAFLEAAEITN